MQTQKFPIKHLQNKYKVQKSHKKITHDDKVGFIPELIYDSNLQTDKHNPQSEQLKDTNYVSFTCII